MNNDLISREALKNELNSRLFPQDYSTTLLLGVFNELIDNAPTVEPICPYLSDNEVKQPCLNSPCERPQGEWIKNNYGEHHCNKCGHFALYEEYDDEFIENASRFCPHCGADMKVK